jgi:hypothetical protein
MMPCCARRLACAALAAVVAGSSSCTVADNLSAGEILDELDAIVTVRPAGADTAVLYATRADISRWFARASLLLLPIRPVLVAMLGGTANDTIELPRAHVRELLRELPDEVGRDPLLAALAVSRLGWIAEYEQNAQSRVVAIDGLARIAAAAALPVFQGDFARLGVVVDPEAFLAAKAAIAVGAPAARGAVPWAAAAADAYARGLASLTAAPLDSGGGRLRLLEELTGLWVAETDERVLPAAEAAVRAAMQYVFEGVLLRIVQGRAPEYVDLRLCAMEHVRAFGGPASVPLLLAVMASTAAEFARGESRFDPDPLVQLRLIHFCGQLRGDLAASTVRLPGRDGVPLSPADFLANTILTGREHYSKLRLPALVALTWSLQRPRLDPDPGWVREWRTQRR